MSNNTTCNFTEKVKGLLFLLFCHMGIVEIAKLFYSKEYRFNAFEVSCKNDNTNVAQWLYEKNKDYDLKNALMLSTQNNCDKIVRWISTTGIDVPKQEALYVACENGNLNIVKWLHITGADINENNDCAFRKCCKHHHKEIAIWLYLKTVNIRANDDEAFIECCKNNDIRIASWLVSLCPDYKITTNHNKIVDWSIRELDDYVLV